MLKFPKGTKFKLTCEHQLKQWPELKGQILRLRGRAKFAVHTDPKLSVIDTYNKLWTFRVSSLTEVIRFASFQRKIENEYPAAKTQRPRPRSKETPVKPSVQQLVDEFFTSEPGGWSTTGNTMGVTNVPVYADEDEYEPDPEFG